MQAAGEGVADSLAVLQEKLVGSISDSLTLGEEAGLQRFQ
jgi:hypothetical protein